VHGLRALVDREGTDREIDDEVEDWLERAAADLEARGVPAEEARRRVRLELGRGVQVRETVRSYGWENVVESIAGDVRVGVRRLVKNPGFTALTVLTLAVGIGATTAIFSVAKPVLFDPLPYPDSDRVLSITDRVPDGSPADVTFGSYLELAERIRSFEAMAVLRPWEPTLTGAAEPERLTGQRVSAEYFRVLGVAPVMGRPFDAGADRAGGPNELILGHGLWRDRFGTDSAIVGRQVTLDGASFTVIGVMGPDFENVLAPSARVWALLQYDAALPSFEGREWGHHLGMVGRLRPGVPADQAARELDQIAAAPLPDRPRPAWAAMEQGLTVTPLKEEIASAARPGLLAILGAVSLLLVIACVNLMNLLLGRGVRRRGEFAMRAALGARRGRLIQQLLTESLLLSLIGGIVGIALGAVGVRMLIALSPPQLPRLGAVEMDATVFAVALGISAVVGAVAGLLPAVQASRSDPQSGLRGSSNRTTGGHRLARNGLVVAEVTLTLVLLVGAGLLLRSLDRLFAIDPGFEPGGVVALQVQASGDRMANEDVLRRFFAEAAEAVGAVPGVATVGVTSQLPLSGEADEYGVRPETGESVAGPEVAAESGGSALRYAVSPEYFEALSIPLRAGRFLKDHDDDRAAPVAVISESLAGRLFPGGRAVGERLHIGRPDLPPYTVVGVVGDVKQTSLAAAQSDAVYVTPEQWYFPDRAMWFVVRGHGNAAALTPAIRSAIWRVDASQPISRATTMDALVMASTADRRFALRLFGAFSLAALLLAAIGLYGVMAGDVAERSREMGIRSALGATRSELVRRVLHEGLTLALLGVVLGLAAAMALSRSLATLLYEISPLDPVTYAGVVVLLVVIAATACAVPAWRAGRVDPAVTLRLE